MLRQRPRASMLRPVRRGLLRPACTLTAAARICPRSRSQAIQPREQRRVAVLPAVHVGDPADSAGPAETSGAGRPLGDAPRRPSGQPHRVPGVGHTCGRAGAALPSRGPRLFAT
eukprot:356096-Chlamydomonas_euryale.AAC.9